MSEVDRLKEGRALPVMESFYSIQGEGAYSGFAAHFVRLAGCDVGCHWCDVKESWDEKLHPMMDVEDIVKEVMGSKSEIVIITGGEPLMWNLGPLTRLLKENGKRVHIETSGAHDISGEIDWVCLSPKKIKRPVDSVLRVADELKVVVYNNNDFEFAKEMSGLVNGTCRLTLQPEWSKREEMTGKIVTFVLDNPEWRISLQTHKYLEVR